MLSTGGLDLGCEDGDLNMWRNIGISSRILNISGGNIKADGSKHEQRTGVIIGGTHSKFHDILILLAKVINELSNLFLLCTIYPVRIFRELTYISQGRWRKRVL